jgi:putative ATPase
LRLRNAPTRLMGEMGYGKGYRYPHNFDGHYVPERYLPEELADRRYYTPTESGQEAAISARLRGWEAERAARRSSAQEVDHRDDGDAPEDEVRHEGDVP